MAQPRSSLALVMLCALALPAIADDDNGDRVSGFSTNARGELKGVVTDEAGAPLAGVEVHVASPAGEQVVITEADGSYRVDLGPTAAAKYVFVRRVARITGQHLAQRLDGKNEVVDIQEMERPKVMPVPLTGTNFLMGYSKAAQDQDAWAKAWLLLDVSEEGVVTRVKMLKAPGYGLDDIALTSAFQLPFRAARNSAGRKVSAMVLWSFEWPSYNWMLENGHPLSRVPQEVKSVPCRQPGSVAPRLRDCAKVDMAKVYSEPWILPGDVKGGQPYRAAPEFGETLKRDRRIQWTLVGAGAGMLTVSTWLFFTARDIDDKAAMELEPGTRAQLEEVARNRRLLSLLLAGAGVASVGLGAYGLVVYSDGAQHAGVALAGRF
jgi:hypothetical protein